MGKMSKATTKVTLNGPLKHQKYFEKQLGPGKETGDGRPGHHTLNPSAIYKTATRRAIHNNDNNNGQFMIIFLHLNSTFQRCVNGICRFIWKVCRCFLSLVNRSFQLEAAAQERSSLIGFRKMNLYKSH